MKGVYQVEKDSTDVTLSVLLEDAYGQGPKTGVTITDLDIYYIRIEDDNDVTISSKVDLSALTSLTDAHADNSGYEIGKGRYRIDFSDAVFASGAGSATIIIEDGTNHSIEPVHIDIQLTDINALATFIKNWLEGDTETDTSNPAQYQLVKKIKDTDTELGRKDVSDIDDNAITDATTSIANIKEPS